MLVICEGCGQEYTIDPLKIKGDKARFQCSGCDYIITIVKPAESPTISFPDSSSIESEVQDYIEEVHEDEEDFSKTKKTFSLKSFGLRGKMLLLFFLIPIVLIIGANALFLGQMNTLSQFLMSESSSIVENLIEEKVGDSARKVAAECALYLEAHPDMKKEDFINNEKFKKLALQKIGKTGYSALYDKPDSSGAWRTWVHVSKGIIGIDMFKLKPKLGKNFPGFWKVYTGVKKGGESRGYYTWYDKNDVARKKFMVCVPVAGTSFIVASTTYVDEFTGPIKKLEVRAKKQTIMTRNIVFAIFGGSILLIGFIVIFFGYKLSGRIQSLTDVANRISVGEMDAEIEVEGKDEITDLGAAISRMQESIRLALERLRRK